MIKIVYGKKCCTFCIALFIVILCQATVTSDGELKVCTEI